MIAALRARLAWTPSALLLRDLLRASRRWQTYAARVAFSAVLIGLGLGAILAAAQSRVGSPSESAQLGRAVFIGIAVLQTLVATVAAPLLAARGVIEERDDQTLEVLLLTGLSARQILLAKLTSRLLHLVTLILGALPILALAMTLGGVSPIEVVAVTAHSVIATLVMGSLGGYFAVHTRAPLLATGAALSIGLPAFLLAPAVHSSVTFSAAAAAQVSPLFGSASRDWTSLLPVLFYLPMIALTLRLTAGVFELRASGGRLRGLYAANLWRGRRVAGLGLLTLLGLVTLVPVLACTSCTLTVANSSSGGAPAGVSAGVTAAAWLWELCAAYVLWWGALRIMTDVVLVADESFTVQGLARHKLTGGPRPFRNPVAWREIGPRAWRVTLPGAIAWTLGLVVIFQAGVWLIPGGLLAMGAVQALAALVVGMWLGATSIEAERSSGALTLLLTSTMSSWSVLWPKLLGALLPAGLMLALAFPMIGLGLPYLQLALDEDRFAFALTEAALTCLWLLPLLPLAVLTAMITALRVRNPRNAYAVALGLAGAVLVVPVLMAALLPSGHLLLVPVHWVFPVLNPDVTVAHLVGSTVGIAVTAVGALVVAVVGLRRWGI